MESIGTLCDFCKHYRKKEIPVRPFTCDAFPDGIPDKIYFEAGDHRIPVKGDNGIFFERRADMTAEDEDFLNRIINILDNP